MNPEMVVDCVVILDGENNGFLSYMKAEEALRLQECGLAEADEIHLRETPDRQIPESLKKGESVIEDIWVKLEANQSYYIN